MRDRLRTLWERLRLSLLFSALTFVIMLSSTALVFAGLFILSHFGIVNLTPSDRAPLLLFALDCLIVGIVVSLFISRVPLKPLREIIDAMRRVTGGDYSVRVAPHGSTDFKQLAESFNDMASELGSVELLRNDFINDFSHEFKTPIVSIRGFAKALKWDNLGDAERNEYLNIIIEESERLSALSGNVLMLSRVENQSILTDKTRVNISEQLRLAIVMLLQKWEAKDLEFDFDSEEIYINGNEELLKQIWINLLDNAAKFSPEKGKIYVCAEQTAAETTVRIEDEGVGITAEERAHIFDKFYQADTSHATVGNGLGLALVKRIAELHGGTVTAQPRTPHGSVFLLELPGEG